MSRRTRSTDLEWGRIVVRHVGGGRYPPVAFRALDVAAAVRWVLKARRTHGARRSRRYHWIERIGAAASVAPLQKGGTP